MIKRVPPLAGGRPISRGESWVRGRAHSVPRRRSGKIIKFEEVDASDRGKIAKIIWRRDAQIWFFSLLDVRASEAVATVSGVAYKIVTV